MWAEKDRGRTSSYWKGSLDGEATGGKSRKKLTKKKRQKRTPEAVLKPLVTLKRRGQKGRAGKIRGCGETNPAEVEGRKKNYARLEGRID